MSDALYIISDLHLHNHADFGGPRVAEGGSIADEQGDLRFPGCNQRALAILAAFERVIDRAAKNGVGTILLLGDVFDVKGSVPLPVFNAMTKLLAKAHGLGIRVPAIPGNHDYVGKSANWSSLNSLYSLPYISVAFEPTVTLLSVGQWRLAALLVPYMESRKRLLAGINDRVPEIWAMLKDGRATHSGLFMHVSVRGAVTGSHEHVMRELLEPGDLPYEPFNTVVSGHVHRHQVIKYKSFRLVYCGALLQKNRGEADYVPGFLKLTLGAAPNLAELGFIENKEAPRFVEATVTDPDALERIVAAAQEEHPVRTWLSLRWEGGALPAGLSFPANVDFARASTPQSAKPRMEIDLYRDTPESLVPRYVERAGKGRDDAALLIEDGLEFLRKAKAAR